MSLSTRDKTVHHPNNIIQYNRSLPIWLIICSPSQGRDVTTWHCHQRANILNCYVPPKKRRIFSKSTEIWRVFCVIHKICNSLCTQHILDSNLYCKIEKSKNGSHGLTKYLTNFSLRCFAHPRLLRGVSAPLPLSSLHICTLALSKNCYCNIRERFKTSVCHRHLPCSLQKWPMLLTILQSAEFSDKLSLADPKPSCC